MVLLAGPGVVIAESVDVPASLDVDLRSAAWATPIATTSIEFGGIIATAEPEGMLLTHSDEFGLGVTNETGPGTPLIENIERIRFEGLTGVTGVWVRGFGELEDATVEITDATGQRRVFGFAQTPTATSTAQNFFVSFGESVTGSVTVSADITHEVDRLGVLGFSISVPLPTTGMLAAAGLGFVGIQRRR